MINPLETYDGSTSLLTASKYFRSTDGESVGSSIRISVGGYLNIVKNEHLLVERISKLTRSIYYQSSFKRKLRLHDDERISNSLFCDSDYNSRFIPSDLPVRMSTLLVYVDCLRMTKKYYPNNIPPDMTRLFESATTIFRTYLYVFCRKLGGALDMQFVRHILTLANVKVTFSISPLDVNKTTCIPVKYADGNLLKRISPVTIFGGILKIPSDKIYILLSWCFRKWVESYVMLGMSSQCMHSKTEYMVTTKKKKKKFHTFSHKYNQIVNP